MSLIFSDDFSSYSVGNNAVPPYEQIGLGGTVIANGFRGKGFQYLAAGGIRRNTSGNFYDSLSIYYYFKFPNASYNTQIFQLLNGDPTFGVGPPPIMLFRLGIEPDGSLTAITAGVPIDNSGSNFGFSFYPNEWYFIQINVKFDVGAGSFVTCDAKVAIDGKTVIDGLGPIVSTQNVSGLSNGLASVNKFEFSDMSAQSVIDEIIINSPKDTFINYPNPGVSINARASQMIVEHADLVDDAKERITQMIIEHADLPDNQKIRITQMIIEIAATGIIAPREGWKVRYI